VALQININELRKQLFSRQCLIRLLHWRGSFLLLGVTLAVVTGLFLSNLLRLPTRTPLLIVSSSYQAPWDVNPWQDSNVALMKRLGDHAYRVKSIEATGSSLASRWIEFEDAISQLDQAAQSDKPLLIYLNLHGIVDPDDRPCLIYRESTPLETETWISFESLLQSIDSVLRQPRAIVFLCESGRQNAPWQSTNGFASSLHHLFERYPKTGKITSLVGISTTRSTPFENIIYEKGDHFTRHLAQGLSGQCDRKGSGGNEDRQIDLSELHRYIEANFAESGGVGFKREPNTRLLSAELFSAPIAWAGLANPYSESRSSTHDRPYNNETVASIWREFQSVDSERVWRNHPAYWSLLKQTAIDLEAMHQSYHPNSVRIAELQRAFERLKIKCQEPIIDPKESSDFHLKKQITLGIEIWTGLAANPSIGKLKQLLDKWESSTNDAEYHPTPFLYTLLQQSDSIVWSRPDLLQTFARSMIALESARLDSFRLPCLRAVETREQRLDTTRREMENRFLAGAIDNQTLEHLKAFETDCAQLKNWTTTLATSIDHYYLALSDVLPMVRAGLVIDRYDQEKTDLEPSRELQLLRPKLIEWIDTLARNADYLISDRGATDTELFVDVAASYSSLSTAISTKWLKLIEDGPPTSEERFLAISHLLNSGFIPKINATPESTHVIRQGSYRVLMNHLASKQGTNYSLSALPEKTKTLQHNDLDNDSQSLLAPLCSKVFPGLVSNEDTDFQSQLVWRNVQRVHKSVGMRFDESAMKQAIAARLLTSEFGLTDCAKWVHSHESRLEERRAALAIDRHAQDFWHTPDRSGTSHFVVATDVIKNKMQRLTLKPTDFSKGILEKVKAFDHAAKNFNLLTRYSPAATIHVSPELSWTIKNEIGKNVIPPGRGAVRLIRKNSSSADVVATQTAEANAGDQSVSGTFSLSSLIDQSKRNDFVVQFDYRGHRCSASLAIHSSPSLVSITNASPLGPAVLRLEETGSPKSNRTLILDCSASMFEPYDAETNPIANGSSNASSIDRSKLAAAKRAVVEILERWSNQQCHVGVVFFGHRVSASGEKQGNLIQDKYFAAYPFSPTLQPYGDVEPVLPVGRFTDVEKSKVLGHLDSLLPWGQTPLYLSLYTAIQQSANTLRDEPHDIMVISDGRNYQFNPHPSANITIDAVIELAKRFNTRIHLIGFGIPKSEFAEASEQYQRLASETGGSTSFQIADSVALVERINSLTQPQPVLIQLPNTDRVLASTGSDIPLPTVSQINTPLTIDYKGITSTFPISPASGLKLFVSHDNKITSAQYVSSGLPSIHSLITPEQSVASVQLGVHSLKKISSGYAWDLSLLSANGGVAPRPKYHLAEIEPKAKTESSNVIDESPRYLSFNSSWLPNTPHPVMQLHAANWPSDCDQAILNFWCTDLAPAALAQWAWNPRDVANADQPRTTAPTLPETDDSLLFHEVSPIGVRCYGRLSDKELLMIVYHDDAECKVCDVLPLATLGTAPERTERDYRPRDRMSIHRFSWAAQQNPVLKSQKNSLKLVLLDLKSMKNNALHLTSPVTQDVSSPVMAKPISTAPIIRR
jgi:hypothetical protein